MHTSSHRHAPRLLKYMYTDFMVWAAVFSGRIETLNAWVRSGRGSGTAPASSRPWSAVMAHHAHLGLGPHYPRRGLTACIVIVFAFLLYCTSRVRECMPLKQLY